MVLASLISLHLVYSMIAAKRTASSASVQQHLSLGSYSQQMQQLCHLSTLLWSHSAVFSFLEFKLCSNDNTDYVTLGSAWINMGLLHTALLAPRGAVDTVYRSLKWNTWNKRQLEEIENELEVQNLHYRMMTGGDLMESSQNLQPPQVQYLMTHQQILLDKKTKLQQKCAFRPNKQETEYQTKMKSSCTTCGGI
ncbi:hypothetical protein ScPMuIL_018624 [Solemya velum]